MLGDGFRAPSPVQLPPPATLFPDVLVGGRSLERRDDPGPASARHSSCRNAVRDPCGRGGAIHWRLLDAARQSGTVPGWPSCRRKVGLRPESLGRVSAATLRMSGRYSGCRWDQVLVPHVRRLPHSRSVPFPAPQRVRSALPNPGQALPACRRACSVAPQHAHRHQLGVLQPGRH